MRWKEKKMSQELMGIESMGDDRAERVSSTNNDVFYPQQTNRSGRHFNYGSLLITYMANRPRKTPQELHIFSLQESPFVNIIARICRSV